MKAFNRSSLLRFFSFVISIFLGLIPALASAQTIGVQVVAQLSQSADSDPAKQAMAEDYLRRMEEVLMNAGFERGMITFNLPPILNMQADKPAEINIKDYSTYFSQIRSGGGQGAWILQLKLHIENSPLRCLASSFDLSTYDLRKGVVASLGRVSLASTDSQGASASDLVEQISEALEAINSQ